MPEHDGPIAHAREHALVVITRLDREALDVGERRAVHIEDSVHLDLRLQRVTAGAHEPLTRGAGHDAKTSFTGGGDGTRKPRWSDGERPVDDLW
jgi:hypothetical protein